MKAGSLSQDLIFLTAIMTWSIYKTTLLSNVHVSDLHTDTLWPLSAASGKFVIYLMLMDNGPSMILSVGIERSL